MTTREDPRWMRHGVTGAYVFNQCCTQAAQVVGEEAVWQHAEEFSEEGSGDWIWWDLDHAEQVTTWYTKNGFKDSNQLYDLRAAENVVEYVVGADR